MHIEKGRIGQFFLFVGFILFLFFLGADQSGSYRLNFLCLSIGSLVLAIFLIWKDWKAPSASERFRTIRKMTQKKPGPKK